MPPKKKSQPAPKPNKDGAQVGTLICGARGPGPQYKLKNLVGFKDHCLSKYRNPAYTFGIPLSIGYCNFSPGTTYSIPKEKSPAFTIGLPFKSLTKTCTPGPYKLPDEPKRPAFSMKWRTKYRGDCTTPGPYYIKSTPSPPAFTIGLKLNEKLCTSGPGPMAPTDLNVIKPRAPKFSIGRYVYCGAPFIPPGPKYYPKKMDCVPKYTFGVKHHECALPLITECDERY